MNSKEGVARNAGLLREDGDLREVLDHDAKQDVVRDLADAGEIALADIGDAVARDRLEIGLRHLEGVGRTRDDAAQLACLDGLAVAADRRCEQRDIPRGQLRADAPRTRPRRCWSSRL